MPRIRRLILLGVLLAAWYAIQPKSVQWQEEVPLNTGKTIWVTRKSSYSLKGGAGNPLDIRYRPDRTEELRFVWDGKEYIYRGDAALMLLAISPKNQPVLVAPAADRGWDWNHNYYCTQPHYVQFLAPENGSEWKWLDHIEPWLYGMQHNLMRQRQGPEETGRRYTAQQRAQEDRTLALQAPSRVVIDPRHVSQNCKRKF